MQDPTRAEAPRHSVRPRAPAKGSRRKLLGTAARGSVFFGAALLLGSCPLLFGAVPLGLGLLAAASSYTWYILGGLLLSAALRPAMLDGWAWVGVYLLCVILRLVIRFFVDPPVLPDGRPCGGRTYLLLCWESFKHNLGFSSDTSPAGDTETDYYEGLAYGLHPEAGRDKPPRSASGSYAKGSSFPLFAEHPFLRMLTAGACGLAAGLSAVVTGGFHVYDLLTALTMTILSPVAAFLLVSCFGEAGQSLLFAPAALGEGAEPYAGDRRDGVWKRFHALPILSVSILAAAVVYASRSLVFPSGEAVLRVSLSTLLALLLTLQASARLGVVPGVAAGAICGLAADPRLSPIFILCAGSYALLRYVSHRAGVLGGCAVGMIWCVTVEGMAVLATQLPAILLAMPLYFAVERLWSLLPGSKPATSDGEVDALNRAVALSLSATSRAEAQRARMQALSDAFGSLSKRFYDLSSRLKRPRMLDLRRICDESFTKQCAHCKDRDICWGAEYERTLEVQTRLASQLHTAGKATAEALPDSLRDFCPYMEDILSDVNGRLSRMTEALLRSERTDVFAADYAAFASLLSAALEEDLHAEEDFSCNREAADAIYDYLRAQGVGVQGVVVGGKRGSGRQRVIVRGTGFEAVADKLPAVRARIGELVGCPLTAPAFDEGEDGDPSAVMTLSSEAKLTVTYAGSTLPADRPPSDTAVSVLTNHHPAGTASPPAVCGDHIAVFGNGDAYFYALISDGMGSGEEASLTSDICAMFLEKMLSAGNRVEVSLKMLDGYIRSKNTGTGEECSATVDLMELDLMDGRAVFAKNGAAPTYVVREGTVYKLHSPSLPIGILKDTPGHLLRFRTHPGDVVVMVSDGITLGNDECPWLIDLLSEPMPDNMDSLRRDIIRRALTAGSEDDLSAIAIRVEEK